MAKQTIIKEMTLYNDYDYNVEDYCDEYLDYCDCNGIEVENEIPMDFIHRIFDEEWFGLFDNLEKNKNNTECVVLGSLGLWYGRRDIIPTRENTLANAIKKCVGGCDYTCIKIVDGHIEVKAIHHDGTNEFEIHILNKLGQKTIGADLTKKCYHCKIKGDFWG